MFTCVRDSNIIKGMIDKDQGAKRRDTRQANLIIRNKGLVTSLR